MRIVKQVLIHNRNLAEWTFRIGCPHGSANDSRSIEVQGGSEVVNRKAGLGGLVRMVLIR